MENINMNVVFSCFISKLWNRSVRVPSFPKTQPNASFVTHASGLTVQTKQTSRLVDGIIINV